MATIHRYLKSTIKNQVWEISIIEDSDSIMLYETHFRKDNSKIIKEVKKALTKEVAEAYKESNKYFHVETYET